MSDPTIEGTNRIRRSLNIEIARGEDDFDETRTLRSELTHRLMAAVRNIDLIDNKEGKGELHEDTESRVRLVSTALKALEETDKAAVRAIGVKLKQSEQEIASATATKDRLAVVIRATAPGRIEENFPVEQLELKLAEMFDDEIQAFELKTNPKDLED